MKCFSPKRSRPRRRPMAEADIVRPDVLRPTVDASQFGVVQRPLSIGERIYNIGAVRKLAILVLLAAAWEIYARWLHNDLLFPTFGATLQAFVQAMISGGLLGKAWTSIKVLLIGYAAGIALAAVLTTVAISSRVGTDFLETLTSMFNPLWAVALNTHSGFLSVSNTLRMVGRNYGLHGLSYVGRILIPAAFPSILTGLKIGWAFAWRTLIAAELVFGVSSGSGGLGWFIYENKNQLEIANVFAGLFTVIMIGLLVENVIFRTIEQRTVRRWGMQNG